MTTWQERKSFVPLVAYYGWQICERFHAWRSNRRGKIKAYRAPWVCWTKQISKEIKLGPVLILYLLPWCYVLLLLPNNVHIITPDISIPSPEHLLGLLETCPVCQHVLIHHGRKCWKPCLLLQAWDSPPFQDRLHLPNNLDRSLSINRALTTITVPRSNTITTPKSLSEFQRVDLKALDGARITSNVSFTHGRRG